MYPTSNDYKIAISKNARAHKLRGKIDGHDFEAIEAAFAKAREVKGQPSAIVIKSVKGKGVSFMENDAGWHGKAPNDAEYAQAMSELKAQLAELEA